MLVIFFFFQAEDGIRDTSVTGVQTCALPIYWIGKLRRGHSPNPAEDSPSVQGRVALLAIAHRTTRASRSQKSCVNTQDRPRSEERRVGKECRSRWGAEQ